MLRTKALDERLIEFFEARYNAFLPSNRATEPIQPKNLRQTFEFLRGFETLCPVVEDLRMEELPDYDIDFADVRGQHCAKRAIEVGIAGSHNLLILNSGCPH